LKLVADDKKHCDNTQRAGVNQAREFEQKVEGNEYEKPEKHDDAGYFVIHDVPDNVAQYHANHGSRDAEEEPVHRLPRSCVIYSQPAASSLETKRMRKCFVALLTHCHGDCYHDQAPDDALLDKEMLSLFEVCQDADRHDGAGRTKPKRGLFRAKQRRDLAYHIA